MPCPFCCTHWQDVSSAAGGYRGDWSIVIWAAVTTANIKSLQDRKVSPQQLEFSCSPLCFPDAAGCPETLFLSPGSHTWVLPMPHSCLYSSICAACEGGDGDGHPAVREGQGLAGRAAGEADADLPGAGGM